MSKERKFHIEGEIKYKIEFIIGENGEVSYRSSYDDGPEADLISTQNSLEQINLIIDSKVLKSNEKQKAYGARYILSNLATEIAGGVYNNFIILQREKEKAKEEKKPKTVKKKK